jgi:LuxR family maltose regulon positive regulatory protein
LQVAVLTRMNAAVCQAVTGEPASQDLLETLERSNLFVVPLDEQRQWYRLHDLFREALLVQAQANQPDLLPHLRILAAQWYEQHGEVREAIVYALAATDYPYAACLLERAAPSLWRSGEAQSVLTWMAALPDAVLSSHARLALDAALHLLESLHEVVSASYRRAQAQVEQTMARLQALLQSQGRSTAESEGEERLPALPDGEMTVIHRRLRLLQALLMSREVLERGDAERLRLLVQEIEGLDEQEEVRWKMVSLSLTFWLQRQGALLITRLLEAKRQALVALDHRASVRVMIWLAYAYGRTGQWRLVEQECQEALALVDQIGEHTAMTGYLHLFLADCYLVWNRLEEASGSLHQVLSIAQAWQQTDLLTWGNIAVARIALAQGDLAAADQALQQAEAQERSAEDSSVGGAVRAQYWLAAGDLDRARNWAEQLVFSPQTWNPTHHTVAFLVQVQVSLACAAYPQAIEALERFMAQFDQPGDIPNASYFLALYVVALYQTGKLEQAQAVAARLLALTEQEGDLRTYLDAGKPMKQVLQSLLSTPREQAHSSSTLSLSFVAKLVAAFEQEGKNTRAHLLAEMTPLQALALPQKGSSASPAPIEPLTRRELEVLRLLAEGASNQEIANTLVISLTTVKKHVSNLLGKLGAASRTQAIAQAHALSLL